MYFFSIKILLKNITQQCHNDHTVDARDRKCIEYFPLNRGRVTCDFIVESLII